MDISLHVSITQSPDAFIMVKEWAPILVSSLALFATAFIAWVTRSAQKDTSYRDIQKMFRDFYAVGINGNEKKQKIIASIANPLNNESEKNTTSNDLQRLIILDYLVILETCYLESNKNQKNHNHNMIRKEILKIQNLPGFNEAMKQYFHRDFKKFIETQLKENL